MLLGAIARVESGRLDVPSGHTIAWPWTLNVNAVGHYYASKAEAVDAILAVQAEGFRSIDVGCMQINLQQHPNAFASLEDALDPDMNAHYGARFLTDLHRQTKDWGRAIQLYHSQTEKFGAPYLNLVASSWPPALQYISMTSARGMVTGSPESAIYTASFRQRLREDHAESAKLRIAYGPIERRRRSM